MNQFSLSGQPLTPGQRGIMAYRQNGGKLVGGISPVGGMMQARAPLQPGIAPQQGMLSAQPGQMPTGASRIRPPSAGWLGTRMVP